MSTLDIFLFGGVRVSHTLWPQGVKVTRAGQSLLAYLLLQRHRSHQRDTLAGLFWGDHRQDQARSCLSTALWRLRSILEPGNTPKGTYLQMSPLGEVSFNKESDYWLDVARFEDGVTGVISPPVEAMRSDGARTLKQSLDLYTGDLLDGFYDDWALHERERVRGLYLNSLARLMAYYKKQGEYEASLDYGQQLLQNDPLREDVHREIMRLYLETGQRALAIKQYELCREILADELGIAPMDETRALREHLQATGSSGSTPISDDRTAPGNSGQLGSARNQSITTLPSLLLALQDSTAHTDLKSALRHFNIALQGLDAARDELKHAIELVQGYVERDRSDG